MDDTSQDAAVQAVQALIDALPDASSITSDNAEDVNSKLQAIDSAMAALSDDQKTNLDITKYSAAKEAVENISTDAAEDISEEDTSKDEDAPDEEIYSENEAVNSLCLYMDKLNDFYLSVLDEAGTTVIGNDEYTAEEAAAKIEKMKAKAQEKIDAIATDGLSAEDAELVSEAAEYLANGFNYDVETAEESGVAQIGDKKYSSLSDAVAEAASSDTITLLSNTTVSETITISKKITIDLGGYTVTSNVYGTDTTADTFLVTGEGNLTLKNGTILSGITDTYNDETITINYTLYQNNKTTNAKWAAILQHRRAIEGQSGSTVTLTGVKIGNFATTVGNGAAVLIDGGTLKIDGGSALGYYDSSKKIGYAWVGNAALQGGAVYATESTVTINNAKFYGDYAGRDSNGYGGGGAVYLGNDTNATITSGDFQYCYTTKNTGDGYGGGAIKLDQAGTVTVTSSFINKCYSSGMGGGGICTRISDKLTIKNTTIQNCTSTGSGGGLYVLGGKITLSGITITGNEATTSNGRGGGISFNGKPEITQLTGTISNNKAGWGGGIDYTEHNMNTLVLKNVEISGNTAARGGGIWACPTATVDMNSTLGGVIYGNTATGGFETTNNDFKKIEIGSSGDDVRYEASNTDDVFVLRTYSGETSSMTLTTRTPDGYPISWYPDEANDRYETGDSTYPSDSEVYTGTTNSFGSHSVIANTTASSTTLTITGNTASGRGGGIATNSPIEIGQSDSDFTLTVNKVWNGSSTIPEFVEVTLCRVCGEEEVELETVTLTAETGWTYTFYDLPAKNSNGDPYTYTVKDDVENWTDTASGMAQATDTEGNAIANTYTITLTNTYTKPEENTPEENIPDTPTPTTTITEEDTPLADLPEGTVEIEEEDTPLTDIEDEETALANVPNTSDGIMLWCFVGAVACMSAAGVMIRRRKSGH